MKHRLALAALAMGAVASCDSASDSQPAASSGSDNGAMAAPAPAPAEQVATPGAASRECAATLRPELDSASFTRDDVPVFEQQRLEAFREAAAAAFRAAAAEACSAGEVPLQRLASLRRLLIQSASGATEVTFYEDQESAGAGTLVFQWVFAEENLAVPQGADIRAGLACWADPAKEQCAGREP